MQHGGIKMKKSKKNNSKNTISAATDEHCSNFHEDAETHALRRTQDIECLTLLTEAARLKRQMEDIDSMMATLHGGENEPAPISPAMLMAMGLSK
jgi:hypothetical protein